MSHANPIPFHRPCRPCTGHARPTNPMPIPSKKYLHFMLYKSSIFLVTSPLSVGHPAPPSTPLVRPRTAVCSRGARARRERSGSGAPADGYMRGHRAAAAPCPSSARHVQPCRSRGRSTLPFISAAPRTCSGKSSHQQPLTPRCSPLTSLLCCSTWHMAGCSPHVTECAHARSAVPCVTERECPRNGTEGAHARSAVPCVTERECPRNGTEGAHARSAVPCVTERPPLGVLPHALP